MTSPVPTTLSPTPAPGAGGRLGVKVTAWQAVAAWTWDAGDDVCGICRAAFDGCPPEGKFPGDDSPVVWGVCNHAYHLQCITKVRSLLAGRHCSPHAAAVAGGAGGAPVPHLPAGLGVQGGCGGGGVSCCWTYEVCVQTRHRAAVALNQVQLE
jgi:anaphase-promoting complex subunit 11